MRPASPSLLLPAQPTPLVGRAGELEAIRRLFAAGGARLLTLTGPAGVGKTRLALAAAADAEIADRFPDGIVFVDLTPVREPHLVLSSVAGALGLLDMGSRPLLQRLAEALGERRLLVVLDNFEQVLPAATQLADLLAACPGPALLVTSRVPLQLRWEQTLRVAPLAVPDPAAPLPPPDALLAVPAVALFVGRARARRADFVLSEKQAPLVAQVAVQLDGLPLALELAAARLDVLSLPMLARRLGDRLRLLASGAPDRPERQRSLEAAVGWSYDLLSEPERVLFRCLGVFIGRVALDAIAVVAAAVAGEGEAGGADAGRTLQQLVLLAEQSLVVPLRTADLGWQAGGTEEADEEADEDAEPAFGMLETVRVYAEERLAAAGELAAARQAHAHYFTALAERAEPELRRRDQRAWLLRLERERDNLRMALRWLLDGGDRDGPDAAAAREAGLRLAGALGWFWLSRGYHAEGVRWLEEALARAPDADASVRTRALLAAGEVLAVHGEVARARAALEEALALAERRQDPTDIAQAFTDLGLGAVYAGEVAEASRLAREALPRWEALGDPDWLAVTLTCLGLAADATGDIAAAATHYADSLRWYGTAGDAQHAGFSHCFLGVAEGKRGDLPRAVAQIQATVLSAVALRNRWLLSVAAQSVVALVGARADPERRARLSGAADALAQATGATPAAAAQDVVGLRERLAQGEEGEGEEAAAYRAGRALPFGAVASLALHLLEEVAQALPQQDSVAESAQQSEPPAQRAGQSPLSEREAEVLRLVAAGLSNKAIGRQLFLSASTVNYHLTAIFNKLGVDTRAQAVAVAARRGFL